ncbi:MAG: MFS transporter [Bacteroidota bacterium]
MNSIQKTKFTSYQWMVILLLALTQFTVILDFMVMNPLGDILMKQLSMTTTQFGIVFSSYAIAAGISGFISASFADKFDRKKLLIFFYVGFIIGTILCGLAPNYWMMVSARIFTGIFGGVIGSISMAIIADLFESNQRGRVMGFVQMAFGISQVLGIPIGLYIASSYGWHMPFFAIAGLALLIALGLLLALKPVSAHLKLQQGNPIKHMLATIVNKEYRVGFLATAFLSIGGYLIMPWGSAYAVNNLGIAELDLPLLFFISGIATLLLMPIVGILSDRINKFYLFTAASIWMCIVAMVYTHMSMVSFTIVVAVNIAMMIGITSRMVPSSALTSSLPMPKDRGAFMSINASLQQISGGIAAAVGGLVVVQDTKTSPLENFGTLGYMVTIAIVLSIILMSRVSKIIQKRR